MQKEKRKMKVEKGVVITFGGKCRMCVCEWSLTIRIVSMNGGNKKLGGFEKHLWNDRK